MSNKDQVIAETRCWVENVVVHHNLCPFAHKPARNQTIRYVCTQASNENDLVDDLINELMLLRDADHAKLETTILVVPNCLQAFDDYNQFLNVVDMLIEQFALQGVIQVASFHPDYQFADLDEGDVRNYTNRSPYPMFHLILEENVEQARATYPDVEAIPENNMKLLKGLGIDEVRRQLEVCRQTRKS